MANIPFISTRKHIKWGDDPASEDTDTLVLTTAAKYFVDVRIYLPTSASEPSLPTSSALPLSRLEWGFAGTSKSTPASDTKPSHTEWTHWVDNRTTDEVRDEGDMYPQPNGEVLEYGEMTGPKGVVEKYEECWVDLHPVVLKDEGSKRSWTWKTQAKSDDKGGLIIGVTIRIGQYLQSVLRKGDEVVVGRWEWKEAEGWERTASIGELPLPGAAFQLGKQMKLKDQFKGDDGLIWECVETFDWS